MRIGVALLALALAAGGAAAPREPPPLRGASLDRSGLRLLVADDRPFVFHVDTGRVVRPAVPAVKGVVSVRGVAGKAAVVVADAGANALLYAVRSRLARVSWPGWGADVVPAAAGGWVWVDRRGGTRCTLRVVALDGGTLRAPRPFPCATTVHPGGSLGIVVNRTRLV